MNPLEHFFVELLVGITLKIWVKSFELILVIGFTRKIKVILTSKYFIELAPGWVMRETIQRLEHSTYFRQLSNNTIHFKSIVDILIHFWRLIIVQRWNLERYDHGSSTEYVVKYFKMDPCRVNAKLLKGQGHWLYGLTYHWHWILNPGPWTIQLCFSIIYVEIAMKQFCA